MFFNVFYLLILIFLFKFILSNFHIYLIELNLNIIDILLRKINFFKFINYIFINNIYNNYILYFE